ncbi:MULTISPECIES: lipopolysaccharide biosynthesis protein [unclassified Aureimonas]|uniref:lipopolysaccharide biosynthesis protein n=1 Tax=unclassified Aureimonas TaxID=2615206 RepID=UPI0006F96BD7|nr:MULTISPECIES: lipopolysaccharide biosynthesis protein [unclassified Aureimonas]KQT69804.1 transporter [Aureimonas sp. Leaf427]KQT76044.1 transporter [Aureimonas sp. Leaf460]
MVALADWTARLKGNLSGLRSYAFLLGGSAGRLVLSLAYFVSVANGLTVSDFGLFATASATGIVLSRIAGLGFVSPLYRVATVKPQLIGTYTVGLGLAVLASLPLVALAAAGFYLAFFMGQMSLGAFLAIIAAEIFCWRLLEVVVIVNNGIGRFGRGASIVVVGSAVRALAAVAFAAFSDHSLLSWSLAYLAANAAVAALSVALFYPPCRLRFAPRLYLARWRDSVSVAGAEIVFYLQSELDKLLVLSLGGPHIAGIYAIVMRLVDLTALPIRSFSTMIVQKLMKTPQWLDRWRIRWSIEGGIAAVSIAGLAGLGGFLQVFPNALGGNVAGAAPLVLSALLVPAFRNLVEYQSELLYARGRTTVRALVLALVGLIKAGLLFILLQTFDDSGTGWIVGLNGLFLVLWMVSAAATYTAFDWAPSRRLRRRSFGLDPAPLPGE